LGERRFAAAASDVRDAAEREALAARIAALG
jgi:hypothetical protein